MTMLDRPRTEDSPTTAPAAAPTTPAVDNTAGATDSATDIAVEIEGLVKSYGDFRAVAGIDLSIRRGEIFGLLGPNGAGKTTTIDMIVGLREPSAGRVRVLGLDPATDRQAFTSRVAVQPQEASLFESLSVAETLRLFASMHEYPRPVAEIAAQIGLDDQATVKVRKLSGGQKRRLLLGVALIGDPEVVVLDEPSAGLDPSARQSLWGLVSSLRDRGTTVVVTTHHMDEATVLCDRVAIVVDGAVVALGSPDELVRQRSGRRRVSFTVSETTDVDRLLAGTDAQEIAIVRSSTANPGAGVRVTVSTDDSDALIAHLSSARAGAHDLTVTAESLEDVFLALAETSDYESRSGAAGSKRKGRKNR